MEGEIKFTHHPQLFHSSPTRCRIYNFWSYIQDTSPRFCYQYYWFLKYPYQHLLGKGDCSWLNGHTSQLLFLTINPISTLLRGFITLRSWIQIPSSLHLKCWKQRTYVKSWVLCNFRITLCHVLCHDFSLLPNTRTFKAETSTAVKTFGSR